jgi:hypothetical protein
VPGDQDGELPLSQRMSVGRDAYVAGRDIIIVRPVAVVEGGSPTDGETRDRRACPYKGLDSFEASDAAVFFGREQAAEVVLARIEGPHDGPLIVSGASGSGKSSLLASGHEKIRVCGQLAPGGWPSEFQVRGQCWSRFAVS